MRCYLQIIRNCCQPNVNISKLKDFLYLSSNHLNKAQDALFTLAFGQSIITHERIKNSQKITLLTFF